MKYITILDFETSRVFQYDLEKLGDDYIFVDKDMPTNEELEEIITDKGHNLANCEWMAHDDSEIWADHSVGQVIMKECY